MNDRNKAFAHYKRHVEDMKVVVSPDQLLVYSVQQGWGSLCEFLGVPVPVSKFPNVNDRPGIMKTIHEITRGAYVILGAGLVGFAGLAYGALRFFSLDN